MKIIKALLTAGGRAAALGAVGALAVTAGIAAIALAPADGAKPLTTDQVKALAAANRAAVSTPPRMNEPARPGKTPNIPEPLGRRTASNVIEPMGGSTWRRMQVFGSPGGFVTAGCTPKGLAVLDDWSAAPFYRASVSTTAPTKVAVVNFSGRKGYAHVSVEVRCVDGSPRMSSKVGPGKLPPISSMLLGDGAWSSRQK